MSNFISIIFLATSLFFIIAGEHTGLAVPWLFKVLPIICLALAVAMSQLKRKKQLLVALFFCGCGDIILQAVNGGFAFGLASFLIAHLVYIALFHPNYWSKLAIVIAAACFTLMMSILYNHLGDLLLPVAIYMLVIVTMWAAAFSTSNRLLAVGASSFVISDSLIAIDRFIAPLPLSSEFIMLTYYFAQWAIVYSYLRRYRTTNIKPL